MTDTLCATGCDRPTRHTLALCEQCLWEIRQALDADQKLSIPALLDDLATTLTRQARISRNTGSRSAERPVPFHVRASDIAAHTRGVLTAWVRDIAAEQPDRYPADTIAAICAWLLRHTDDIARHPAAADIHDEITDTAANIRRVIDRPADRVYAGTCDAQYAEGAPPCDEPLYANPGAPVARCRDCQTVHDVQARRDDMLNQLDSMLLTATDIARLASYFTDLPSERSRKLLVSWASRDRITPHSHDREGRPLYPFGDVLRMLLATPKRERVA